MRACLLFLLIYVSAAAVCPAFGAGTDFSIENTVWGDIYFQKGSARLSEESKKGLDEVAGWIKKHPRSMVLLAGYDERGGSEAARVGGERAAAVADYLASAGTDPATIKTIGFGDTKSQGVTDAERAMDRRVRYRVVDMRQSEEKGGGSDPMAGVCQRCKK